MRGDRDDHENFLVIDEGPNPYRKDEAQVNMRRILGTGRRKPWKANRIEFGPALKALLNSSENR